MGLHIAKPLALALLLIAPLIWWVARRSYADLTAARAKWLVWVRVAVVALLAVAIARIVFSWRESDVPVAAAFCVDVSGSVGDPAKAEAEGFIARALAAKGKRDRAGIVAFDGTAALVAPVAADAKAQKLDRTAAADRTDIGEALRLAILSLPPESDRRIVLLTDGRQTEGDARAAAEDTRRLGIRIDIDALSLSSGAAADVAVAGFDLPAFVRQSQPFEATVTLASTAKTRTTVRLFVDDLSKPAQQQDAELAGAGATLVFPVEIGAEGPHVLKATAETAGDAVARNDSATAIVKVGPKPNVLVVASDAEDAKYLARALETQQFNLRIAPPDAIPNYAPDATRGDVRNAVLGLLRYDVIILSNINAKSLTKEQMLLLNSYVYDFGGGLVMVGGKDSFGSGGWYKTPVEAALPVYTDPLKEAPVFAVVLIMDKSWSMGDPQKGDISKIDVVKESTIAAIEKLTRKDHLAVLSFDTEVHTILPMQRAEDIPRMTKEISTMASFGLTNFYPALVEAQKILKNTVADYKHVMLLSDGRPSGPGKDYEGQIEKMRNEKIVLSSIAIGVDADKKLMNNLAAWGKGQYYYTDRVEAVPELVLKETGRMKELLLVEGEFGPRPGPAPWSPMLKGFDVAQMPAVLGFNRSRAKETAQIELIVSAKDEPLLASWRYGAGVSVAFTSDAKNVWCTPWVGPWEKGFSRFWRQLVFGTLQVRRGEADYRLALDRGPERTTMTLDAVDRLGRFIPGRTLSADVTAVAPDGTLGAPAKEEFKPEGPGRYAASLAVAPTRALLVEVKDAEGQEAFTGAGAALAPAEYLTTGPDDALLDDLRKMTAGQIATPDDVFKHAEVSLVRVLPFDAALLTLAAILFAADVLIRRLPVLLNLFARRS